MPGGLGPRFAIEAGFLVLVAVGAAFADLSAREIVLAVGIAWVLVALVEWFAWRERGRFYGQHYAAGRSWERERPAATQQYWPERTGEEADDSEGYTAHRAETLVAPGREEDLTWILRADSEESAQEGSAPSAESDEQDGEAPPPVEAVEAEGQEDGADPAEPVAEAEPSEEASPRRRGLSRLWRRSEEPRTEPVAPVAPSGHVRVLGGETGEGSPDADRHEEAS
jgi:hypothetical protein